MGGAIYPTHVKKGVLQVFKLLFSVLNNLLYELRDNGFILGDLI